jgi:hypothetical protein
MIHNRYERLRKAAETNRKAELALSQIDHLLAGAFPVALSYGVQLNGSDPAEQVAEALALWFASSDDELAEAMRVAAEEA